MYCLRRFIPLLVFMTVCVFAHAQSAPSFRKEISFTTDNDNYTLQRRDGYYTNGFNLSLHQLAVPRNARTKKAIMRYELGQMIFNPYKYSIVDPMQMDRPFSGFLFARVTRSRFFENNANLQYGIMAGVLGPSSGAKAVQRKYHELINIYEVPGWEYQLRSEASVNLQAQYTHPLAGKPVEGFSVDLHGLARASLGSSFTHAAAGVLFRMGFIENADESAMWNSRLHSTAPTYLRRREFFLFFQPEVMAQAYNATLQGGMFREDKGPVTADLNSFLYQHRIGLMFANRRFSASFSIIHRTREAKNQYRKENYGSIGISYRMRS